MPQYLVHLVKYHPLLSMGHKPFFHKISCVSGNFNCANIILVLYKVIPLVKSSSFKSSLSIITVPALPSAISAGHTGYLSNSSSAQHSYKYNTLWYRIPMPKSEATFTSFLLLVNPCNSKEKAVLS